jgi:NAD(P)-dependent dehydrogenase (short-subunit alcohol dehydrogenase family)
MSVQDQVVIVGGTRGLGKVVAERFAEQHYAVTVVGRSTSSMSPGIRTATCDLATLSEINALLAQVQNGGPLRYLIFAQRLRAEGDTWEGEIQVGLTATKQLIEALLPFFSAADDRAITLVSSVYAQVVGSSQPLGYHVAKAGLNQLARYYAATLGPRGIRVNSVMPMTYLKSDAPAWKRSLADSYHRFVPLGRMGTVTEVCDAIEFLSSNKASFISGQSLVIDGGTSCVWNEELALTFLQADSTLPA